jgi:hypothetical protein
MKTHTIVAGVAVAVGLLIAPAVASANPPGTPPIGFVALGELDSDGKAIPAQVVRDSISSVTAGVSFGSNIYPQGAAANQDQR